MFLGPMHRPLQDPGTQCSLPPPQWPLPRTLHLSGGPQLTREIVLLM